MTLHLVKLCVGTTSIEDLETWQRTNRSFRQRGEGARRVFHTTFQWPKRQEELLSGGSLYWVIKGLIQARQRVVGFEQGTKDNGSSCCRILLDPEIVRVRPLPRKAFQGWRYLDPADAPEDISASASDGIAAMPQAMRQNLAQLGLI